MRTRSVSSSLWLACLADLPPASACGQAHATYHRPRCEHCDSWVGRSPYNQRAPFGFHDGVVCRSISAGCSRVLIIRVVSRTIMGVSYTSRGLRPHNSSPRKLSREVKMLHRTGRCARHFLAYETVCYAYRPERCTVYAVPSAQVSSSSVRAFSSSFANLHLDIFSFCFLEIKAYFNVDSISRCYWASRQLYSIKEIDWLTIGRRLVNGRLGITVI